MLRSLLIGVNGSQWSQAALGVALSWAKSLNIPVTCLGVVDVDALTAVQPVPLGAASYKVDRDKRLVEAAHVRLDEAFAQAVQKAAEVGVELHTRSVEGSPAEELGKELQRHDLLLVGRRATPHTDRDPPASTTLAEILRHASRPVVVTGSALIAASPVVIAYDGSAQASRALSSFLASGLFYGHPLHLVGITDHPSQIQDALSRAADYLAIHGQKAEIHVLPLGAGVAPALSDFARSLPAGLVVMGVYGQPRLKELFFGSVTTTLLASSPAPLFLDH